MLRALRTLRIMMARLGSVDLSPHAAWASMGEAIDLKPGVQAFLALVAKAEQALDGVAVDSQP